MFTVTAQAEPGQLDAVRETLLATLEKLAAVPFEKAEVERPRSAAAGPRNYGSSTQLGHGPGAEFGVGPGDWRLLFLHRDRLQDVTAADVNRVARTYLKRTNRTVGVYIPVDKPERLAIPAAPSLESLVKDYKGGAATAAGEAFDSSLENLDARTRVVEIGGLKAGLLQKKNRGETVSLLLTLHYGNEESRVCRRSRGSCAGSTRSICASPMTWPGTCISARCGTATRCCSTGC